MRQLAPQAYIKVLDQPTWNLPQIWTVDQTLEGDMLMIVVVPMFRAL